LHILDAIIFRPSAYKSSLLPNEILLRTDRRYRKDPRHTAMQKGAKPTVGFIGKAGFETVSGYGKIPVEDYVLRHGAKREGLYFRRKALALLRRTAASC